MIPLLGSIFDIIDKVIPDTDAARKAKAEVTLMSKRGELDLMLKQIEVNKEEAKSSSLFVAGARPAIMWICGTVFGYHYLVYPIIKTIAALYGVDVSILPSFDLEAMWPVLGGLLGLGTMRSFEKGKGVSRENMK